MAVLRQSAHTTGQQTCPFPFPVLAGSLLIVVAQADFAGVSFTCTDSFPGNVYQARPQRTNPLNNFSSQMQYVMNQSNGANIVTCVPSAAATLLVAVHEFMPFTVFDSASAGTGVGNAQDSGPITTQKAYEFLFGYEGAPTGQNTITPGPGWTQAEVEPQRLLTQYRSVNGQGTFNSTTTTTSGKGGGPAWVEEIIAFFSPDFQVGELYTPSGSYPVPSQPGGINTPVTMPVQTDGEKIGLWVAGCQHWFNHWNVYSAAVGGVTSALICCPVCGYIQRIITPYSAIHSDANMILFA